MENETVVHFEGNLRFEHTDHMISGVGNGPIDAFFNALKTVGITNYKFVSYSEHAVSEGANSKAISYIQLECPNGNTIFSALVWTAISVWLPLKVLFVPSIVAQNKTRTLSFHIKGRYIMKEYQITVLKGDGIGPEIVDQAIKVLNKTAEKFDFKVNYQEEYIGGAAIDATGEPLPQKTVDSCKASDAVILWCCRRAKMGFLIRQSKRPEAGFAGAFAVHWDYMQIYVLQLFLNRFAMLPL